MHHSDLCEEADLSFLQKISQLYLCAKMQTSSRRDFSHKSNAGRPTRGQCYNVAFSALSQSWNQLRFSHVWKTLCRAMWMGNGALSPYIIRKRLLSTKRERRFFWGRATSSSYPPSSDSMTKVPTLGMATSTVRRPGDSSSLTRSGGRLEGVLTWTSGWGEEGGGRDCKAMGQMKQERQSTDGKAGNNTGEKSLKY